MLSHEQMKQAAQGGRTQHAVYVYEAPVRLWHWITVLAMTVLVEMDGEMVRRTKEDAAATRNGLIDAAERVFCEKG